MNWINPLPFSLPTPSGTDVYEGQQGRATCNSMHNPVTGDLLFFIIDGIIYDAEGYIIANMSEETSSNIIGFSETVIIPDPGNCSRYYIFSSGIPNLSLPYSFKPIPFMAVLDLTLPRIEYNTNRYGDLVSNFFPNTNTRIYNMFTALVPSNLVYTAQGYAPIHIAATPKLNDNSHLIVIQSGEMINYTFKLTPNGIQFLTDNAFSVEFFAPLSQLTNQLPSGVQIPNQYNLTRSELEIFQKPDGGFMVIGNGKGSMNVFNPALPGNIVLTCETIYKYELNASGYPVPGTISIYNHANEATLLDAGDYPKIKSFEVAPNKQYLYFTSTNKGTLTKGIYCLDLNTFTLVDLPAIPNSTNFQNSRIETASNGSTYLATANGITALNFLNFPASANIGTTISLSLNMSDLYMNAQPDWIETHGQYLLPDQMDFDPNCQINCYSYNCAQNNQEIACCQLYSSANVFNPNVNYPDYVVETSQTWTDDNNPFGSSTVEFAGNLVIRPGVTLKILNMTLKFSNKSRVIIERDPNPLGINGAVLETEYTTFTTTDACGACFLWPGIEVQGHNTLSQSSPKQARVDLRKGTIIEHAYFGLITGRIIVPDQVGQGFWEGFAGGIIRAEEVTFLNNRHDIYFTEYNVSSSQSSIYKCDFLTDADLRLSMSQLTDLKHIIINGVRGVQISNSTFDNQTLVYTDGVPRGEGIRSMNSEFVIKSCTFHQLDYGIYAQNANSALPFSVLNSDFVRNFNGVFALNVMNLQIVSNNFDIYSSSPNSAIMQTTGIGLTGCNRYRVEQNSFTDNSLIHQNAQTYGVVVFNSGTNPNVIENNSFSNLYAGGASAGVNAVAYTSPDNNLRGLQWLCNDFNNNKTYDLWVRSGRIAPWQGACNINPLLINMAAGNTFNSSLLGSSHIFLSNNVPQIRYFHGSGAAEIPTVTNLALGNVVACSSNYTSCTGGRPGANNVLTEQDLKNMRMEFIDEKYAASLLLDYSDKDNTINQVLSEYLTPQQKRDLLVTGGTVISDEVLIKYMLSFPPHTLLYQVLVHNSPLSDKVIYYMIEESDLTNGMKQQILHIQNGIPENEAILQHIQNIDLNIAHIESGLISYYLQDSTSTYSVQDVVNLLSNNPHKEQLDLELLFYAHLSANNFYQADSLNTILKTINTDLEYAILNDLAIAAMTTDYYTVIHNDSLLIAQLEEIADYSDFIYAYPARAILSGVLGYKFEYPIDEDFGNRNALLPKYTYDDAPIQIITIFPNPTTEHFFIVFDENADVSQNREARIYDLAGNLQFARAFEDSAYVLEVNTENMTKGMYIVVLSANGTDIGTYKVAVR
jgi:hypothetical protein